MQQRTPPALPEAEPEPLRLPPDPDDVD
jgi:hypothetical protein